MFSTSRSFSPEQWERVNNWLDRIYDDFITKVAKSRDLTRERVHELARGRVWTGADAQANGLVDELGGLEHALGLARKRAGLAADAPVRAYPKLNPLERLRGPESSEDKSAALARVRLDAWGPLARLSAELGLPASGPLSLPGWYSIR
jgi:protease IV